MIILIDTREQDPLEFSDPRYISKVERRTLKVGDYGVRFEDGEEPNLIFERKSKEDLFSTMTSGYERWKREWQRAMKHNIHLVLAVEVPMMEVYRGSDRSSFLGSSMVQKLETLRIKYGLETVYNTSRKEMALMMVERFAALGRIHKDRVKFKIAHIQTGRQAAQ